MTPTLRRVLARPTESRHTQLVVIEGSHDLGKRTTEIRDGAVIFDGAGAVALPLRLTLLVARFERENRAFDQAFVFVAARADLPSVASRELVARLLLAHMTARGGELILVGDGGNPELREALLGLVETLLTEHEGSPVTIRVQFRDPSVRPLRPSGVRSVVMAPLRSIDGDA